jgi:hypothetical protein
MTDARWRARSIPEIVDAVFQLYRADGLQYIAVAALASAPWLIVQLIVAPGTTAPPVTPAEVGHTLAVAVTVGLGGWLSAALMTAVIVKLGSHAYLGEPGARDVLAAVRDVVPRIPAILGAAVIKYVLLVVGLIFLLVGGLYVVARFFAVFTTIVLEGKGPLAAFARSSELARGRKWHILGTMLLVWFIYLLISLGITAFARMADSTVVLTVASYAYTIVGYPFIGLAETVLYYDARIRGEGLDVELMAGALGPAATEG